LWISCWKNGINSYTFACILPIKLIKALVFEASNSIVHKIWSKSSLCWWELLMRSHRENLMGVSLNYCSKLLFNFFLTPHYAGGGGGGIWFGIVMSTLVSLWVCHWPFPWYLYWLALMATLTIPTKCICSYAYFASLTYCCCIL